MANIFHISGMTGEKCKNKIENTLNEQHNIDSVSVSLKESELIIRSDNEYTVADVQEIFNDNDLSYKVHNTTFNQ